MRILMLNPPFLPMFSRFSRSPAVTKSGTIYYPNWHAYATGWLEKKGHEVILLDAPADNLTREDCFAKARVFAPAMIVLYTATPSIYNDIEIAGLLKEILPNAYIVLTGPHVSALPEESLRIDDRVDIVARREYDETLVDLASAIENKRSFDNITGISWRDGKQIKHNADRPFIQNLDELPFVSSVYKKHLNLEHYFYAHCRFPVVSIFSSRGCNAMCNYCIYPEQMFGRRHRQRSPENIVAEFEYIQRELPMVKEVLIDDDTFSFKSDHTIEFCKLMIKRNIRLPWTVECRANLGLEVMKWMRKAGCRLIVVGFESADDQILKNIKKGVTYERMRQFVRDAKKAGILIHSCFMAGNQGETKSTLHKSLNFAMEINADTCQFFPLMVYPGSPAYDWAKEKGYLTTTNYREWLTPEGMHNTVLRTDSLSAEELVDFCDQARRIYYLRPRYLLTKLFRTILHPKEIIKTLKATKIFIKYLFRSSRKATN